MASILALSEAFGLSTTTGTLAMMLGLAVGIDYALFVVSRYREERAEGRTPQEATALATGTAGSAVVFTGLTVVIALAGLSVVGIPMLTKMGLAAAGAVVVAVLIALTLVPALLGCRPNAVLGRKARKSGRIEESPQDNGGIRWSRFVLRRPVPVLVLGVIGLGALAVPMTGLQLGMPGDEAKPTSTTARRAYDALAEGFGPGFNGPLTIVVDAKGTADPKAAAETVAKEIGATKGIVSVSPARFNEAGDTAVFSAEPATAPTDEKTKDLVTVIRDERPGIESDTGATFEITGTTALNIDISGKVQSALVPYLLVVVGLAVILLMVVFRSLLVPLKAAVGFLLSVLASLGVVVLVFQQGHGAEILGVNQTGPIMSLMPIFLVGIVFGLAMDYEVFLVSRMREAYIHGDTRVLILTTFEIDEYVAQALRAGASGFLGKDVTADVLLDGIRAVAAGDTLLSPTATRTLITRFLAAPAPGSRLATPERLTTLTTREREVMALVADGLSNDEIAEKLYVSPLTVRTHVHRAMTKLGARDRAQLVVMAYQSGLAQVLPPQRAGP